MMEALDLFMTRMIMFSLASFFIVCAVLNAILDHSLYKTILGIIMAAFFFTLASYTRPHEKEEITK